MMSNIILAENYGWNQVWVGSSLLPSAEPTLLTSHLDWLASKEQF
jgi:hypothetical protein